MWRVPHGVKSQKECWKRKSICLCLAKRNIYILIYISSSCALQYGAGARFTLFVWAQRLFQWHPNHMNLPSRWSAASRHLVTSERFVIQPRFFFWSTVSSATSVAGSVLGTLFRIGLLSIRMTAKWTASFPLLPSLRRSRLGKHFTVRQQGYSIKIQGYFRRSTLSTPLRAFLNPKNDKITWMHGLMKSGTCAQTDIRRFAQSFNSAQHRKRTFVALATFLVHLHFLRSKAVIIMLLPSRNSRSIMSVAGPNLHVNVVSCCYTQSDCGSCFAFLGWALLRQHHWLENTQGVTNPPGNRQGSRICVALHASQWRTQSLRCLEVNQQTYGRRRSKHWPTIGINWDSLGLIELIGLNYLELISITVIGIHSA